MKNQRRDNQFIQDVACHIKKLREAKGVSQEVFYIDTDINIARIESGSQNITISTLKDICVYFEISISSFFEDIER